ncbi:hypothetical protein K3495_g10221 [Podosphaera aphanis]|nr:hypothetical protein K3495_g10221 [Podosphaera aphanis]
MSRNFFRRSSSNRDSSSVKHKLIRDFGGKNEEDSSSVHGLGLGNGADKKVRKREPDLIRAFVAEGILPESSVKGVDKNTRSSGASICPTMSTEYDDQNRTSNPWNRPVSSVAELMDTDRSRVRREKTFVGSECAVCEEPLEHTLRGERILQFSCGHVSHEACFYEHIKEVESQYCPTCNSPLGLDTNRGGNVLDIEKLSSIVRSVSACEPQKSNQYPTQSWDNQTIRPSSRDSYARTMNQDYSQENRFAENHDSWERAGRYLTSNSRHSRQTSENTHNASVKYPENATISGHGKAEYELQAMEIGGHGGISPGPIIIRNPIPPPSVSVRSELPTLNRSREQQTLTCLVTVEVKETNWRPNPADLRSVFPSSPIPPQLDEQPSARPPSPVYSTPHSFHVDPPEVLEEITENLRTRVDNWHGLDFSRFGKLRLYATIRVGKDRKSWQELECFLFAEMLICVKEKKISIPPQWNDPNTIPQTAIKCALKGSILIKKHLKEVIDESAEENVLTLSLSVAELPSFYLRFDSKSQLKMWHHALLNLNATEWYPPNQSARDEASDQDEEDWRRVADRISPHRNPSLSSNGAPRSVTTAATEYTIANKTPKSPTKVHVPIDIVVVVPISSSMQGVKISIVRDALKFMVQNLGERDRMGLVTFGSSGGATPLVGMTSSSWKGWSGILSSIKPIGQKSPRADVGEGANVAMDLLMQRKSNNPITNILLISDSSMSDQETVDFVISRAEAAKIAIHSFGLGMTHKPDTMVELSTRTKASYMYVKDWMMLRECLAGCLGAMQSTSHQNVKLKLHLPEGSPAKFVKISGALQTTKRATGKDAEASLGDLRFGDKRDILVQLVILPDHTSQELPPQDAWESIVSGLEALGGPLDKEEERVASVEEVPLIQADLCWGDILRDGTVSHLPRPSLLAITMLPAPTTREKVGTSWSSSNGPPIPPHPNVVQRRMELLTSDMLTRALTLVSRGQHDRAQNLLNETRSILKGLGKGGLPPIPPAPIGKSPRINDHPSPSPSSTFTSEINGSSSPIRTSLSSQTPTSGSIFSGISQDQFSVGTPTGIDSSIVSALDAELEASLEWIGHPAIFGRDSRKAILQAIGVISSQRGYTFRTPIESSWAKRISGVKHLTERSKEWREEAGGDGGIMEES